VGVLPRPCLDCGKLTGSTRCLECHRKVEAARSRAREPRPHYGGDYPKRAKEVREGAGPCWWCGDGDKFGDPWQADHLVPRDPSSLLLKIHRSCNIRRAHEMRGG
jgi:5-methylcytosine-specific restriction endonuclease McrA